MINLEELLDRYKLRLENEREDIVTLVNSRKVDKEKYHFLSGKINVLVDVVADIQDMIDNEFLKKITE